MLVFLLVCLLGSCIARLSPRVMVASPAALFASRPSDRPSLLCLFVRRLSGTSPSLVRVVDPSLVFLLESSLSYRCLVASPLGSTGHCVRFGSAVQFYTPRGTVPFDSPCVHSYSICWLSLAATLFTHTLFHAWCPVTLLSLIRCSTVVVTAAASCRRAHDSIARCVVAARLPPSATSVTVPADCSFLAVQRLNAVHCTALHSIAQHCTALHSIAQQHTRAFKRWFLCRSLVLLESFEHRSGS